MARVSPGGGGKPPRQLTPAGGFKLPDFRVPYLRLVLYGLVGVAFVVIVVVALERLKLGGTTLERNALWVGTEWTYETPDDEAVLIFADQLRDNEIGTVYAWVSWLKADVTWAGSRDLTNEFSEVKDEVEAFVEQFKQVYPEALLYAWVSVPTDTAGIAARLDDQEVQQAIVDFSQMAVEDLGFDGVFLNVEQIWNGDEDFLSLLRTVRAALDDETPIAVAIPPDWSPLEVDIPVPPNIVPGTVWDKEYKQRVALLTNQMAVMAYNSGLNSAEDFDRDDYIEWMAYQVEAFAEAVGELETETQLVIGIPSYGPELPAHDPLVENVASALEGVRLGMSRIGDRAQYVQGVAIYASWETDENEWAQFKSGWVDQ